jgi:hypothetical protein
MADELVTRRAVIGAAPLPAGQPAPPSTAPLAPAASALASERQALSVVVVEDLDALEAYAPAWEALANSALEPNVFYEPWMLLPALRAYGAGQRLQCVLVLGADPARPQGPQRLCGLFPLERTEHYTGISRKLPFRTLRFWRKPEITYLCTPLLRAESAREALATFFDWVAAGSHGCSLLELNFVAGDGPFQQLLIEHCNEHQTLSCVTQVFTRALWRPALDAETYLRSALQRTRRKEFKRQERRLSEAGRLAYEALDDGADVDAWIEDFLALEAISWKGKGGRALVCSEADREYFVSIARAAFRRGRLMMLALRFDGRVIAHKCNFLAAPGSFAYKIAFDEAYARYSPGVLLEIENIRRLHASQEIRWMDSCADADRFMINHLWTDRRTIQTVVMGTGRRPGGLVVAAIPLLKWLNRQILRRDLLRG